MGFQKNDAFGNCFERGSQPTKIISKIPSRNNVGLANQRLSVKEQNSDNFLLFDNPILQDGNLLTAIQVARILNLSEKTIYFWAKKRRIPSIMLGKAVRFRPEDIADFRFGRRNL